MSSRRPPCLVSLLLPLLVLFIAILVLSGIFISTLPRSARSAFGEPVPYLSKYQLYTYSVRLLWNHLNLTTPVDPGGQEVTFHIELGESVASITRRMVETGLITNADAFRTYLLYTGLDTTIQAGVHTLSPSMTPIEIAQSIQDATPKQVEFGVLAGWRLEEIAATLPTSGLSVTPEEFIQTAQTPLAGYSFSQVIPLHATLEGFLFPGTYTLDRRSTAETIVQAMLERFDTQVTQEIRQGFDQQGLNLYQAATLASIVEREAVVDEEMQMIASVFYNRLAAGMKLDSDPTVQYALGYNQVQQTWWTNPLDQSNLDIMSIYNTYLYAGLPPGPIANPGLSALQAVAFPAQTPYYYFRAACDGSGRHLFAETLEEHIQNACNQP